MLKQARRMVVVSGKISASRTFSPNPTLISKISLLCSSAEWIIVKDNPPKYGEWVHLVHDGVVQKMPAQRVTADFDENKTVDCWMWLDEDADPMSFDAASHWMPLPKYQPSPEPSWKQLREGQRVRVDHERFRGYGTVEYTVKPRGPLIAVRLCNDNVWLYEAETVRFAAEGEED